MLTKKQKAEFNRLVDDVSSRDQLTRITARLDLRKFVAKHGKEACDAAFAEGEKETK